MPLARAASSTGQKGLHWADGGEAKHDKLITLCTSHHALLHEGGFSVERLADGAFAFLGPAR